MSSRREWRVDALRCYASGLALRGLKPDASLGGFDDIPRPVAIWTEIVFVSICHQTNWDKLHDHIVKVARSDAEAISPLRLRNISTLDAWRLLEQGLDRGRLGFSERVRILHTLGRCADVWPTHDDLNMLATEEVSLAGPTGLYAMLDRIAAFSEDPLRKKARVLAHQLVRGGLIRIRDGNSLAPAIDYHLIRLYVRSGRVVPATKGMYGPLVLGRTVRIGVVNRLRQAVDEAMRYTAEGADMRMDELNHLEWQVARSFCVRELPRCELGPLESKPVDRPLAAAAEAAGGCVLRPSCVAATYEYHRRLQEPRLARNFY